MKKLLAIIPIAIVLATGIFGLGKFWNKAEVTEEKVEKVEERVEEAEDKIAENKMLNREQAIIQQNTLKLLDKLEKRMEAR